MGTRNFQPKRMKRPQHFEPGVELISKLLDESITEAEFARLQDLLAGEADLRRVYLQMVDQEVELGCCEPFSASVPAIRRFPRRFGGLALAAAAVLVASLLALALFSWLARNSGDNGEKIVDSEQLQPPMPPAPVPAPNVPDAPPLRRIPTAPAQWTQDFEDGLPAGWLGEFVDTGLPDGSRGGVRTVSKTQDGSEYRQIIPPISWAPGLVTIGSNTHLHLTLKIEQPAQFDLFMLTHVPNPARGEVQLYKFGQPILWEGAAGKWRRLSIPLKRFAWKNAETESFVEDDIYPETGEVAWQIFVSAPNAALELVIDEWRVDETGSGSVRAVELQ